MGLEDPPPRARHRFGFSGPRARQKIQRVTTDDILDSLTRQAELRQKLGKKDQVSLEEIVESEDRSMFQEVRPEIAAPLLEGKTRDIGHFTFVLMLLGGLIVALVYASTTRGVDLASLNSIIWRSGISSVFANQAQVEVIGLAAIVGAIWIRHRRRHSSLHPGSG